MALFLSPLFPQRPVSEEEGRGQREREAVPVGSHAKARTDGGGDVEEDGPASRSALLLMLVVDVAPPLLNPNDGVVAAAVLLQLVPKLKPPPLGVLGKENPAVMELLL